MVIQETLRSPRTTAQFNLEEGELQVEVLQVVARDTWMTPYIRYIADTLLPPDQDEAKLIKKNTSRYVMIDKHLFRHGFAHPLLTYVSHDQATRILTELHERICGSHIRGRTLASKVIRARYYRPTIREESMNYTKKCEQC